MKHFSISEITGLSWKIFSRNPILLVGLTVLAWALSFIGRYLTFLGQHTKAAEFIALYGFTGFAIAILSTFIHIGILKVGLELAEGKKAKLDDFLNHANLFWKFIAVMAVFVVALIASIFIPVASGFFLAIFFFHKLSYFVLAFLGLIPALYLLLTFCFAPVVLVDTNCSIWASFQHAVKISKHNKLSILGFLSVISLFNLIGMILFGVGLLITAPLTFISFLLLYRKLA